MAIFKSLSPDDVSRVPFNANKLFQFDSSSSSTSTVGIHLQTFEYATSSIDTFSSASTDYLESIKYYQLDHLFYRNHKLDISNTLGDADYLDESRSLYRYVNVLSIPTKLYGNKIKPGSFFYSGSLKTIIDDSKGNLIISGTSLISHSVDEREKVLFLGPVKGFKKYDINYNLYGKTNPNPITYYSKENVYDDSFYINTLTYKNIIFKPQDDGYGCKYPSIHFTSNGSLTSSIVAPHNETYNFNPGEDFTISMYINPVSASTYLLCKSTKESTLPTPIYQPLYTTGSSQLLNLKTQNQYPFEIFIDDSQNLTFRKTDGTFTPTVTAPINTGSLSHVVCMSSGSVLEIWISGSKISSTSDTTVFQTENKADLYIGSKGELSNYYTGSISNLMIFNSSRTEEQIKSLSSSINGSPYIGNIFYSNGLATITHPKHQEIFKPIKAQVQRYYPLNSTATSSATNNGSGSFHDLSRYNQGSLTYENLPNGTAVSARIFKSSSQATFETVTHNNFTGELLLVSSSISESVGLRGREYVGIPNYLLPRNDTWAVSILIKEAAGFHTTASFFMGADLDTTEAAPFNSVYHPRFGFDQADRLEAREKTGNVWTSIAETNRSESKHIVFSWDGRDLTAAKMDFYVNGNLRSSVVKNITGSTDSGSFNIEALGSGYNNGTATGTHTHAYSGSIGQVMFFDHLLTTESIQRLNQNPSEGEYGNIMNNIKFKNIHPIYENEYMCTVNADEYNFTHNISTRLIKSDQKAELANFATGSQFKPYVTTVGLYNENNELLVIGKLGQPVKMSDESDTTFVLRWDT